MVLMIKKEKEELFEGIRVIIKEELKPIWNEVKEIRRILDIHTETITAIMVKVTTIEEDVATLKADVATLKVDVGVLKNDMVSVKDALKEKVGKKELVALGRR